METNKLQTVDSGELVPADPSLGAMSAALAGDLSKLSETDKLKFVGALCQMTGLNPLSKPFDWIVLNGKLTLYANKGCAEQLRKIHGVTVEILERKTEFGVHIVRVKATDKSGRTDESIGAVPFDEKMAPDVKANMFMKAETKAKRRVSLSICSVGMIDESELDQVKNITPIAAQVEGQSAGAIADKLNEAAKPATAIQDAEIVPEPAKAVVAPTPAAVTPEAGKVSTQDPDDADFAPVKPAATVPTEDESETMANNLGIAFDGFKPKVLPTDCVKYLIAQGKLKQDDQGKFDLRDVDKTYAAKILKRPDGFATAVETWVKGGRK